MGWVGDGDGGGDGGLSALRRMRRRQIHGGRMVRGRMCMSRHLTFCSLFHWLSPEVVGLVANQYVPVVFVVYAPHLPYPCAVVV